MPEFGVGYQVHIECIFRESGEYCQFSPLFSDLSTERWMSALELSFAIDKIFENHDAVSDIAEPAVSISKACELKLGRSRAYPSLTSATQC